MFLFLFLQPPIAFLSSLREAGHNLIKKDAEEAGQNEKAHPLSTNGVPDLVSVDC